MKHPGEIKAEQHESVLKRALRVAVMAALAAAFLYGGSWVYNYLKETRAEVPRRPAQERVWPVSVVPAVFSDHRPTLVTYGTTTAARKVDLRALVAGEIVEVGDGLVEGGEVTTGDVLLRIDAFDYEGALTEAGANLAEAKARLAEIEAKIELEQDALTAARQQLEFARRDIARVEALRESGTVSERTEDERRLVESQRTEMVSQRENQLIIDRARAEQQRANIQRLEWRVTQAERNLTNTTLRAPFDAWVGNVNAEIGRLVGANDQVATLIDADALDVRFVLTDAEFGRIADDAGTVVGRPVTVTWRAGDDPRTFAATVERVTPEIDAARGGIEVFARIDGEALAAADIEPRPGAFVEIAIDDRAYRDAARIASSALYGTDIIYVVEDERLVARTVRIVGRAGTDLLVRGDLSEGDMIVTTRITEAGEGLKVRVQNADSAPEAPQTENPS